MKKRSHPARFGLLALFFYTTCILLCINPVSAATVTISWDANTPEPQGYRVFQRLDGQAYDFTSPAWPLDGSNHTETTCTIDGLTEGATYYFVVRAYQGLYESGESNEVVYSHTDADSRADDIAETDPVENSSSELDTAIDAISESAPTEESGDALALMPGEPDSNTESRSLPQPSISEDDVTASSPSLEIFDNSFSHQNWLSVQWSQYVGSDGESRIAMGDIDGDGKEEMVIGLGQVYDATLPGGLFQVVDDDYSLMGWNQIDWPEYNIANGETFPNCGDIDGDGDDEIFIGLGIGGQGMVEVFDFKNGSLVHLDWIITDWPEYNALLGQTHPAAGDIDNDGRDEIVIGLGTDHSDPQIPDGLFQVLDDDFSELAWGQIAWLEYNENSGESYPSVCDLNGDGKALIVMGFGQNGSGRVETFQYDAGVVTHNEWITIDWDDYKQSVGLTRPVCGDVDGDGRDEIIVGLGADPDNPAIPGGRFSIIDDDATRMTWAQIGWQDYNTVNGESFPASGDIDADGIDEIFVGLGVRSAFAADAENETPGPPSGDTSEGGGGGGGCFITGLSHGK